MARSENRFYGDPLRVLPERAGGVELVYADDYDKIYDLLEKVMNISGDDLFDRHNETYMEVLNALR